MPALFSKKLRESRPVPRIFIWSLLALFNASLWLLLIAFHWEISLRSREVQYFGTHLFPVHALGVPLPVIYGVCALMTVASAGAILRDRSNLAARERIRVLLYQILASLEIGVLVLDERNLLTMANDAARRLLPEIPTDYAGRDILKLLRSRVRLGEMLRVAVREGNYVRDVEHDLRTEKEPLPVRITTSPLKDPHMRTIGTLLLIHDVSDTARMERQMRTAERLSALGTLSAAMAHEIRNPLEAMNLNLALLTNLLGREEPASGAPPKTERYVNILESEIARLAAIADNFLSFARPSPASETEIRLDAVLQQVVDLLANQAHSQKVALDLSAEGSPVVLGSEDQLKQAFLNLVINSLEAMPAGGRLRIRTEIAGPVAGGTPVLAAVSIQDTGVGIPPEQIDHLFDPYFTTRPKGTGLGLTIVHRIIQDHRGRIRVTSVPGRGSTFTVELPLRAPELKKEIASGHG